MIERAREELESGKSQSSTDPKSALPHLEAALQLFSDAGDLGGRAECLTEMAAAHFVLGYPREAMGEAISAAAEYRVLRDPAGEGIALFWAASAAGAVDPGEERNLWNRALPLLLLGGKKELAAVAQSAIADFFVSTGNLAAGEMGFRSALELLGGEISSHEAAAIALRFARVLLRGGNPRDAKEWASKAISFWGAMFALSARLGEADARVVAGDAYCALGDRRRARDEYSAALDFQSRQGRNRAVSLIKQKLRDLDGP